MRMFEDSRANPFQFQHITVCHNLEDLAKVPNPKVVNNPCTRTLSRLNVIYIHIIVICVCMYIGLPKYPSL